MEAVVKEGIGILVSGIEDYAVGLGGGLKALVNNLFVETVGSGDSATTKLAGFGALIFGLCGVSLAITLSRWFLNFVCSLGQRNR